MYTDTLTNLFNEFQFSEQLLRPVIATLILVTAIVIIRAI